LTWITKVLSDYAKIKRNFIHSKLMAFTIGQYLPNAECTIERVLDPGFDSVRSRARSDMTYLVKDRKGHRKVLKVLNDPRLQSLKQSEQERLKTKFMEEGRKLAQCRHKHLVKVEKLLFEENQFCLLMEYIDGKTLEERAERQLPENRVLEYIQQIGSGLIHFHKTTDSIHQNICPLNIMLRGNGEAVLIDFGLALDFDHEWTRTRMDEIEKDFAALELFSGQTHKIGPWTDVYSLAATLYELLSGEVPISAEDRKLLGKKLVQPAELKPPKVRDRTWKAIKAGLALDIEDRPPSVQEWLEMLGPYTDSQPKTMRPKPDWSKWATIWTAAGVGVAALGVIATALGAVPGFIPLLQFQQLSPSPNTKPAAPSPKATPPSPSPKPKL
jgi:eukaryotic-like serine/threonine-protein kinase